MKKYTSVFYWVCFGILLMGWACKKDESTNTQTATTKKKYIISYEFQDTSGMHLNDSFSFTIYWYTHWGYQVWYSMRSTGRDLNGLVKRIDAEEDQIRTDTYCMLVSDKGTYRSSPNLNITAYYKILAHDTTYHMKLKY